MQTLLDDRTEEFLAPTVATRGRCLDIGAGGGTVARKLAERGNSVVAVDIETDRLEESPGVEVRCHDINDGVPTGGPFDLVHARAVLMHLKRREEVLAALVDSLVPGGWLVLGEVTVTPVRVASAPSAEDEELFLRVLTTAIERLTGPSTMSFDWAFEAHGSMLAAGLDTVDSHAFAEPVVGGTALGQLARNYAQQLTPPMLAIGFTEDELGWFCELLLDPAFRAWYIQFVFTRGRKPMR